MLSSAATVRVEKATSELLMEPDWTLNIDICDSINFNRWQPKDVVKAVKKRLQHKNTKIQFLALTLLETMIKNCDDHLHFQVVEREILQEMVKIVRKKTDMKVRDKILLLLDSWQEAFGGHEGKYPQFYWAYADLKASGIEFPERTPEATFILNPVVPAMPLTRHPEVGYGMLSSSAMKDLRHPEVGYGMPSSSAMKDLSLSNLASMQSVMELLSEMLKAVDPNDRNAAKDEVIVDLVEQCRINQKKLVQSINSIRDEDEEFLAQGLELNDNLQGLLAKHDAIASGSPLPAEISESVPNSRTPLLANHYEEEDEDDDFAQLARRNTITKPLSADCNSIRASDIVLSTSASNMDGVSSSSASNALTLLDPPASAKTSTKEQDLIDLLSITLSSNASPPRSPSRPIHSDQNRIPPSVPPTEQAYPFSPQSFVADQVSADTKNYVASWARTQAHSPSPPQAQNQPEFFVNSSAYPPPPWALAGADANANACADTNPFASTTYHYPEPSTGAAAAAYTSMHASMTVQHYNSFGPRRQPNCNVGQTTSPQHYVYTNKLFNDLLELRKSSSGLNTSSATSDQGMLNGRK